MRKIVHVDLDAFYASIEQRDDPSLRGRPVVVAWRGNRSVVCAASYEARRYGVRSAMPAIRAERLCPDAVFVPPDFTRYRAASQATREIFRRYADLVEPLSLDEAFLDVSESKSGLKSATEIATRIRAQILEEVRVTASAGIAPNKFLAKVASDIRKPNGQFVIKPADVESFLEDLPVERIPGVGKVTHERLRSLGATTVGRLRLVSKEELQREFGKYGTRLHELSRGIDERAVVPDRPTQSISAEDTFETDVPLEDTASAIRRLAMKTWDAACRETRIGHTVVLKLKTSDFRILTRSLTPPVPPASLDELTRIALALRERVALGADVRYRLVGVGLGNFREPEEDVPAQAALFAAD